MGSHFTDEAERSALDAWQKLDLEPPVDLRMVAELLGVEIHEREFTDEIDGLYLRLPGASPVVAVNNSCIRPLAKRRFTLAHEIGHHVLTAQISPGQMLFFFDTPKTHQNLLERACDRFAALLLMPEHLVRQYYGELGHNSELRAGIMAERFGVSVWAMRRRLKELGLECRTRF